MSECCTIYPRWVCTLRIHALVVVCGCGYQLLRLGVACVKCIPTLPYIVAYEIIAHPEGGETIASSSRDSRRTRLAGGAVARFRLNTSVPPPNPISAALAKPPPVSGNHAPEPIHQRTGHHQPQFHDGQEVELYFQSSAYNNNSGNRERYFPALPANSAPTWPFTGWSAACTRPSLPAPCARAYG